MLHFLSHGDAAAIVETHSRLNDVDEDNVAKIPTHQYPLDYYRHWRLRTCSSIRRVYSKITRPLYTVSLAHLTNFDFFYNEWHDGKRVGDSFHSKVTLGRVMAQAVSHQPLTAEARFRSRISPCGTGFSPSTSVFPCQFHSTCAPLQGKTKKLIIFITRL
jgi:hypothetical protein